jgi:DNA repair protein RecO (recombination protein O)
MKWQDKGIVVSVRVLGEKNHVVHVLTHKNGLWAGVVSPTRKEGPVQPGTFVDAQWNARLEDHLGRFHLETEFVPSAYLLSDFQRLTALSSACALIDHCAPPRESCEELYELFHYFLKNLNGNKAWERDYILFELCLLKLLGFGLTLTCCAVTKQTSGLTHISPKSGHAVCQKVAQPYLSKLLVFPHLLKNFHMSYSSKHVTEALRVSGYFLQRHLFGEKKLPSARQRLEDLFEKRTLTAVAI